MQRNKAKRANASNPISSNVTTNSIIMHETDGGNQQPTKNSRGRASDLQSSSSSSIHYGTNPHIVQASVSGGESQLPEGVTQASKTTISKRTSKKHGPCHFGCLTTAQSNWECSPGGSAWWGIPPGSALCHAHYLRGGRSSRRHGHDPPQYEAPHCL